MILGYNTNGLAHHRLRDALQLCADLGYGGVAITLDVAHLDPMGNWTAQAKDTRTQAEDLGLALSVETGARFLLDPARKHRPNLMDANTAQASMRIDFYRRCLDIAQAIGAPLISLWSGSASDSNAPETHFERLANNLAPVLEHAQGLGLRVAFEPEPGMFVETPAQFRTLLEVGGPSLQTLGMTLDVGHCLVTGGELPQAAVHTHSDRLIHVHLDDIAGATHIHRMFGEGDLDLGAVLQSLRAIDFKGMAAVELSRDSHRGALAAAQAWDHLQRGLEA